MKFSSNIEFLIGSTQQNIEELMPSLDTSSLNSSYSEFVPKLQKNKDSLLSSVAEFKAFEQINQSLIVKLRHVRFFTTLLLKDMLMDQPLESISEFYGIGLNELRGFQTKCSIFSTVVVGLCKHLNWWNMSNLLAQYVERINFVI